MQGAPCFFQGLTPRLAASSYGSSAVEIRNLPKIPIEMTVFFGNEQYNLNFYNKTHVAMILDASTYVYLNGNKV